MQNRYGYGDDGGSACRARWIMKRTAFAALRWLTPLAFMGLVWLCIIGACRAEDKYVEVSETYLHGVVNAMDKYNSTQNAGKTQSVETQYRMMVKTSAGDVARGMKEYVAVDDVAWETYARKKVGDPICFRLPKAQVMRSGKHVGDKWVFWEIMAMVGCVGFGFMAILTGIGAVALNGSDARRYLRDGHSPWYAYMNS